MLLSIKDAAFAADISRTALYKNYINPGKISVNRDDPKKPLIDVSELIRVFPNFKNTPITQGAALGDKNPAQPDQSALAVAELRAENAGLKARIADLTDHIQTLKGELAAAREREIRLLPTQAAAKGFFSRLFGHGN